VISERARAVSIGYVVSDVAATGAAFVAAHAGRDLMTSLEGGLGPIYPLADYLPLLVFILPLWLVVFHGFGLYGRKSARTLKTELSRIIQAIATSGLLLAFMIFAAKLDFVSRPVILAFVLLSGGMVTAGRATVRALFLDTATRRRILIAGGFDEVVNAAARVDAHRDWGLEVVGLATDGRWVARPEVNYRVVGAYRDIPTIVQREVIDEVLFATAVGRVDDLKQLEPVFLQLEELGVVTRVAVNFLPQSMSDLSFDELSDMPMLTFSTAPRDELLLFVRRCFDLALSVSLLLLLSPILVAIALAIKSSSKGPVLFRQVRCGLHGRPFTFLKFRSMQLNAEALKSSLAEFNEMDGPAFKMTNDPRLTSIGGFLRRTSLDELPQLWNIFVGDMSFVGPRPSVVDEVRQYEPWQRRRLSMKPGLTCLWQVSGRSELTFEEWMRLDLEYIDNWSLWLDLKIAFLTIPAVLKGRGAK
jgi:exopolysaccharide biosynthesis polyprenyl glycosylphosphotransferase